MASARIISVNVGKIAEMDIDGRPGQTAIDKRRVAGRVFAGKLGLVGDAQADPDLMRVLLTVEGRGSKWDSIGAHVLGRVRV